VIDAADWLAAEEGAAGVGEGAMLGVVVAAGGGGTGAGRGVGCDGKLRLPTGGGPLGVGIVGVGGGGTLAGLAASEPGSGGRTAVLTTVGGGGTTSSCPGNGTEDADGVWLGVIGLAFWGVSGLVSKAE
jgi:hypothetical protein